nr:NAD(P)H-binding protein [Actinomadura sp. CNU-125]
MDGTGRGKLVVVGAAGRTGRLIVEHGLAQDYEVRAVLRDPSRLGTTHRRLETVTADVLDPGTLDAALDGADAVAVALGTPDRKAVTVFSRGMRNLLGAVRGSGSRRLLAMSSAGLDTAHLSPVQRLVSRFSSTGCTATSTSTSRGWRTRSRRAGSTGRSCASRCSRTDPRRRTTGRSWAAT